MDSETERPAKKRRWPKRVAIAVAIVITAGCVGFFAYFSDYYHANQTADQYFVAWESSSGDGGNEATGIESEESGSAGSGSSAVDAIDLENESSRVEAQRTVTESDSFIAVGDPASEYGLVFYPGAKVESTAYIPLLEKLANQGIYCIVAKMPFNFSFFNINAADALMTDAPEIKHWWIGGHSLGGVVAAICAANHADKLEGIALLAAYSMENLQDGNLRAVVLYGSNDLVVNRESLAKCAGNLLSGSQTVVIEGGNHAGFGDYGAQKGDGEATISADEQQSITADAIAEAMKG